MPKRSNTFQRLVFLVRTNLAAGATVTESKMLRDTKTRSHREVDVCIEGHVGGQPVLVCIECRAHKRPADVLWVEALKAKHERLPTNALLLASQSGFTPEARKVAAEYGIRTIDFAQLEETDFPSMLAAESDIWTKSVTVTPLKVVASVEALPNLPKEDIVLLPDNAFYTSAGIELGPVRSIVDIAVKSTNVRDAVLDKSVSTNKDFSMRWAPPVSPDGEHLFVRRIRPEVLRHVKVLEIFGSCVVQLSPLALRHGRLDDVHVAWGETTVHGQAAMFVATRDALGVRSAVLHVDDTPGQDAP